MNAHETRGDDLILAGTNPPLSELVLHPRAGSIRGGSDCFVIRTVWAIFPTVETSGHRI